MSGQTVSFECASCSVEVTAASDELDEHRHNDELYCNICHGTTAWKSQDFPIWIEMEAHLDNCELGRAVERETGVDLDNIPIARDLKCCVFYSWWKITESGVEGPYDERRGEKR